MTTPELAGALTVAPWGMVALFSVVRAAMPTPPPVLS